VISVSVAAAEREWARRMGIGRRCTPGLSVCGRSCRGDRGGSSLGSRALAPARNPRSWRRTKAEQATIRRTRGASRQERRFARPCAPSERGVTDPKRTMSRHRAMLRRVTSPLQWPLLGATAARDPSQWPIDRCPQLAKHQGRPAGESRSGRLWPSISTRLQALRQAAGRRLE